MNGDSERVDESRTNTLADERSGIIPLSVFKKVFLSFLTPGITQGTSVHGVDELAIFTSN